MNSNSYLIFLVKLSCNNSTKVATSLFKIAKVYMENLHQPFSLQPQKKDAYINHTI